MLIGLFVWFRLENRLGFYYFAFSACAGLWGMTFGVTLVESTSYSTALLGTRLCNLVACFMAPTWYLFTLCFSEANLKMKSKVILWILWIVSFFILINAFSDEFIPRVKSILMFKYYAQPGILYYIYTLNFFTGITLGFVNLFSVLKRSDEEQAQKIKGLIFATGLGFVGGSLSFLPVYDIPFPQYGMWFLPLYPILMAVAMMRFDLFNAKNFVVAAHKDKLAALGILTASINHEIRSPLFMIRGVMESETKLDKAKERIIPQIDRITDIVSRITHFAKKGVDEATKIEALDLKKILAEIRPLFQHQLNYQNIKYSEQITNDLTKVLADRRYFEEILFNLILNACQALKDKSDGEIQVRAQQNGMQIVVEVEDNGPGISTEQMKCVFKPFHTTKTEGNGLGLYITKQLVEKCDGKIQVIEQAKGIRFRMNFPAIEG